MTPATLILIVQAIQAAISAAPQVAAIVVKGKDFIASLFGAGLITQAQQDAVHKNVDAWAACLNALHQTPEFNVEPDPAAK